MKLIDAVRCLNEKTGSAEGKKVYASKEGAKRKTSKTFKGRVKTYASIKAALGDGGFGDIFTTQSSNRLYVISKGKWGKKSGRGKIAKGFTKGSATPSAEFSSVKKHAARTLLRYGRGSKALAKKYGSRTIRKKAGVGGADGRLDKTK